MFQKQPPEVLSGLKKFAKFTEKDLSRSLFFNKLQVLGLQLKTPACEFWENFKKTVCIKYHWVAASEYLCSSKYASLSA